MMFLCLSVLATAVFAGARKDEAGNVPKRKFAMGLSASFPPMGFISDFNEIAGYDVDLAKEACRRLDWELVLQPVDWD
jgi:polar amino acid transport system substrate-binding protein